MKQSTQNNKILMAGGGSGGPVSPLLGVAAEISLIHPESQILLVGTYTGPERSMAEKAGFSFKAVPAGKLRRYPSLKNFAAPFLLLAGFIKSLAIMLSYRPAVAFGAGSYVQVPVLWAAWLCRVPVVIHQQDIVPSLANRLCAPIARVVTVTFEKSLKDFRQGSGLWGSSSADKVVLTGNPFREQLSQALPAEAKKFFGLSPDMPVLYVTGGGTGSKFLNNLITDHLDELTKYVQIIHSTGVNRGRQTAHKNYFAYPFISEVQYAYAAADMVLCRAGLATITELSNLGKIAILVPMPASHQEQNAAYVARRRAAVVLDEKKLSIHQLLTVLKTVSFNADIQNEIRRNISALMPHGSARAIANMLLTHAHGTT